jgi:hypothetical protein
MKVTFNEVSIKATKRWKEDGKTRMKTRKFYQTLNPFNKNADGAAKTRDQIMTEITAERDAWLQNNMD